MPQKEPEQKEEEAAPELSESQTESMAEETATEETADQQADGETAAVRFTDVQEGGYYIVADVESTNNSGESVDSYLYWKEKEAAAFVYYGSCWGASRKVLYPAKPNTTYVLQLRSGQGDDAQIYDEKEITTTDYKFETSEPVVSEIKADSAKITVTISNYTGPYPNKSTNTDPYTDFDAKTEYEDAHGEVTSASGSKRLASGSTGCELTVTLHGLKAGTTYTLPVWVYERNAIDPSDAKKAGEVTFTTEGSGIEGKLQIEASIEKKMINYTVSLSDSDALTESYSYQVQACVKGVPRSLQGSIYPSDLGSLTQSEGYKKTNTLEVKYAGVEYEVWVTVDGVTATVDVSPGADAGIPEVTLTPLSFGGLLSVTDGEESGSQGGYSVTANIRDGYSWYFGNEASKVSEGKWLICDPNKIGAGSSYWIKIDVSKDDEEICTKFLKLDTPEIKVLVQADAKEMTASSAVISGNIENPDDYFSWSISHRADASVCYRVMGSGSEWEWGSKFTLSKSGMNQVTLKELASDTEYEVQIVSVPDHTIVYGTTTFRTARAGEGIYLLKETFPDARLKELVVKAAGLDADALEVTAQQLAQITELSVSRRNFSDTAIKDLTDIDLLTKLTKLDLSDNEIADTSNVDWSKLAGLETLDLTGNELTEIPDLSKNTSLKKAYIDENLIPVEAFQTASQKVLAGVKLSSEYTSDPESDLLAAQQSQRVDGLQVATEEIYYQTKGKSPLFVKVSGYKTGLASSYRITCLVDDGEEIPLSDHTYRGGVWYNLDTGIAAGDHTLVVKIAEGYGSAKFTSEEISFRMEESKPRSEKTPYHFNVREDSLSVAVYSDRAASTMYLLKDGNTAATGSNVWYMTYDCGDMYKILGDSAYSYEFDELDYYYNSVSLVPIKNKALDTGTYDLRVVYEDGTDEIVQGAVEMVGQVTVRDVWIGYDYDNMGDYFYLSLSGYGFDASKLDYAFTYEGAPKSAQYVSRKETWGGCIVKFKKDSAWMLEDGKSVEVKLTPKAGYEVVFDRDTFTARISEGIYYCAYNEVTNKIEIGITSNLKPADLTFTLERYGSQDDMYDEDAIVETITVKTEAAGMISHLVPMKGDTAYKLPAGYYKVTAECGEDYLGQKTFSIGDADTNYWSGVNQVCRGTGERNYVFYSDVPFVNEDSKKDFQAEMTGGTLASPLQAKNISAGSYEGGTKVTMIFDLSALAEGTYTITLNHNNEKLSDYRVTVLSADKFVITRDDVPYASWIDASSLRVGFNTVNVAESDAFTVTLTDFYGKKVEGLTAEVEKRYTNAVYLKVTGLKKSDADRCYYIKVEHKTLGEAYKTDCTTKFFSDEKGRYVQIGSSKFTWTDKNNRIVGIGMYSDIVFPVTVNLYKPYDTEQIQTLTIKQEDLESETGSPAWYYFKQTLIDDLADRDALYDIVAVDSNGNLGLTEKRLIGSLETPEETWTVSPGQLNLSLAGDGAKTGTITVTGSKGTPVFASENPQIATAAADEANPQKAVVTAVAEGTTNIRITADQITRTVVVTVTKEEVQPTRITLTAPQSVQKGGKVEIRASVTPTSVWTQQSSMTWTSSDSSVISIPEKSKGLTVEADALGAGTAVITASLDGTQLQESCTIKVEAFDDKEDIDKEIGILYFLEGAEAALADLKLPQGWSWKNPGETPKADNSHPIQNFMASYKKDDVSIDRYLSVHVSKLEEVRIVGKSTVNTGKETHYTGDYTYVGEEPANGCGISWQWTAGENLALSSNQDRKTTVKAAGDGTLSLKVTITNKTTGKVVSGDTAISITVGEIPEDEPVLENKSITVYQNSTQHMPIGLVAVNGNDITAVNINNSDFKTEQDENGQWLLGLASGTKYTAKKKAALELAVDTESGKKYTKALNVTVDVTEISAKNVKFKQTVKPNTAYSNTGTVKAEFGVSSKYIIEDITAAGSGAFTVKSYNPASGTLVLEAETSKLDNSKQSYDADVKVKVRDYGEWTLPIKVAVQKKKPSLKLGAAVILNGADGEAPVALYNGKTQISWDDYTVTQTAGDGVAVTKDAGMLKVAYTGSKKGSYKVKIRKNTWASGVEMELKGAISVLDPAKAKLEADLSKVTININKDYVSPVTVTAGIKGCGAAADVQAEPAGNKDVQALAVENLGGGNIKITPKDGAAKGSYKVSVSGTVNGTPVKKTSVKVTLTDKAPAVKLSAKGQINLANREGTSIVYTPALKNLPEALFIKEVGLDNTVPDSRFFHVALGDDGRAVLTAVAGKAINPATKYKPILVFTLNDGKIVKTDAGFTVRVVNKLPKVTAATLSGAVCKTNAGHKASYKLNAGNGYTINNVTTDDANFKVVFHGGTDTVSVSLSDKANVTAGKKYMVPCKIYIKGADNTTKPLTVKLKVAAY